MAVGRCRGLYLCRYKAHQGITNKPGPKVRPFLTCQDRVDVSMPCVYVCVRECARRRVIIAKCGLAFTDILVSSVISPQLC